MATLVLQSLTQAHSDSNTSNNPALCLVNWRRAMRCVSVEAPKALQYNIQPGASTQVLQSSSWTSPADTEFSLSVSSLSPGTYRLTSTAGTPADFRTPRAVDLTGIEVVFSVQNNNSVTLTASSGTPFGTIQAGDEVFIPGMMTGDGSTPFSPLNQGRWIVLAQAPGALVLAREASVTFQATNQTVTPTSPAEFRAFSSTGVQDGDKLVIGTGFPVTVQGTYVVKDVTATWVEFCSAKPLPSLTGIIPGAAGVTIVDTAIRYLRVESDQVVSVSVNSGAAVQLTPWEAGNPELVAEYVVTGLVWSLVIVNDSSVATNVTVITAE